MTIAAAVRWPAVWVTTGKYRILCTRGYKQRHLYHNYSTDTRVIAADRRGLRVAQYPGPVTPTTYRYHLPVPCCQLNSDFRPAENMNAYVFATGTGDNALVCMRNMVHPPAVCPSLRRTPVRTHQTQLSRRLVPPRSNVRVGGCRLPALPIPPSHKYAAHACGAPI